MSERLRDEALARDLAAQMRVLRTRSASAPPAEPAGEPLTPQQREALRRMRVRAWARGLWMATVSLAVVLFVVALVVSAAGLAMVAAVYVGVLVAWRLAAVARERRIPEGHEARVREQLDRVNGALQD